MKKIWTKILSGIRKVVVTDAGVPIICDECPCDGCEPETLYDFLVDGREDSKLTKVSLIPWTGEDIGYPGGYWRLLETSDCYVYATGEIDKNGVLVGLPRYFVSEYHYMGHMLLQQGCEDEFGVIHWPASACDTFNYSKED